MALKLLHEAETDDPILSVVNLIDIFLVIIAALLITVAQSPLMQSIGRRDVTVITDPGQPNMQIITKRGEKIEHYKTSGAIGTGDGEKAGVAYRMKDGSIIYVPEGSEGGEGGAAQDTGAGAPTTTPPTPPAAQP